MPIILIMLVLLVGLAILDEQKQKDYMLTCVSETKTKEQCKELYNEAISKTEEENTMSKPYGGRIENWYINTLGSV